MKFVTILYSCVFLIPTLEIGAELKEAKLVEIQSINPTISVKLFLATGINPLHLKLHDDTVKAYALEDVAFELDAIQKELATQGLGLEIVDAFRPMWAQKLMWDAVLKMNLEHPDDYISDPFVEFGRHTRGTAVDVRIITLSDGNPIPLPPFVFAPPAHQNYNGPELTQEQIDNREFLKHLMMKHGFTTISHEWWHFDYKNWRNYKPLNYQFSEIPGLISNSNVRSEL